MVASLTALLLLSTFAAPVDEPYREGSLHTYQGTFLPVKVDQKGERLDFRLTLLVADRDDDQTEVLWHLADRAGDSIPWHSRFGRLTWSHSDRSLEGELPAFNYEHTSGQTAVSIATPLPLFPAEIAAGDNWLEGKIEHEAAAGEPRQGRPTLSITARTLIGRRRTLTIDRASRLVHTLRENVFVGQGEEHLLTYELAESQQLEPALLEKSIAAAEAWSKARAEHREALEAAADPAARKQLLAQLPKLKEQSAGTLLASLTDAAARELNTAGQQAAAVAAMRTKALGQPAPKFELKDTANKLWTTDDVKGKVVVLHFWSYRDENLREPYGQVGYLDFLARRHENVQVLGIAVPPAEEAADESRTSQRTLVRRFREFMNLSYPVLLDDGTLLKKLGDPREARTELPLFIVLDAEGKIAEYWAGLYEVERDSGLKELEAVVKGAAKSR
jgi:hypothetical protein